MNSSAYCSATCPVCHVIVPATSIAGVIKTRWHERATGVKCDGSNVVITDAKNGEAA